MSHSDSSSSSSASGPIEEPLCVICGQPSVGLGPFSRQHLCPQHRSVDVADALNLKERVDEALREFEHPQHDADDSASALGAGAAATRWREISEMEDDLRSVHQTFDAIQRGLDSMRALLTGLMTDRIEAAKRWERDRDDVRSYKQEVSEALTAGDIAQLVFVSESMELSLPDLKADFDRAQALSIPSDKEKLQLRRLREVERRIGSWMETADSTDFVRDASVTATSEEIDAEMRKYLFDPIVFSHELKLGREVTWLAVCSDTSGFLGNRSGRVVPVESAGEDSKALPQPCIIATVCGCEDHLLVLSVDGSQMLRSHCDVNWNMNIWGLHCSGQRLLIAQSDAVTVTDLSGRAVHRVRPQIEGFGDIRGIGGNAASVFVSSGNRIVEFSIETGQIERVITLSQLPEADLRNLTTHDNCILVTDWKHSQVHRVRIDTQQLVASYPTERSGLRQFAWPFGVAVDRRGRLFVSEYRAHSVRAVAADDGSLLWTLGEPGESGSGDDKLNGPRGLAVVTEGQREQLVVAEWFNKRLVVLNVL